MTVPAQHRNSTPSAPTSNVLSPVLRALLEQEPKPERAVIQIATTPELLEGVRAALPALEMAARCPADETGVQKVIGRRFALFPQPDRGEDEWDAWWADYYAVLSDLPEAALEAGMAAWVAMPTSQFLPKPGELKDLALKTENRAARALHRARAALEYREPMETDPVRPPMGCFRDMPEPSKADKELVRKMAKEFADDARERAIRATADISATPMGAPAETDEHGVSLAMRELMARRGGQ